MTKDDHVTVKEAAEVARRSEQTVRRWLDEGVLTKYKRCKNEVGVSRDELDQLCRPRRQE